MSRRRFSTFPNDDGLNYTQQLPERIAARNVPIVSALLFPSEYST